MRPDAPLVLLRATLRLPSLTPEARARVQARLDELEAVVSAEAAADVADVATAKQRVEEKRAEETAARAEREVPVVLTPRHTAADAGVVVATVDEEDK